MCVCVCVCVRAHVCHLYSALTGNNNSVYQRQRAICISAPVPQPIKLVAHHNKSLTNCLLNKKAQIELLMTEINLGLGVCKGVHPGGAGGCG